MILVELWLKYGPIQETQGAGFCNEKKVFQKYLLPFHVAHSAEIKVC